MTQLDNRLEGRRDAPVPRRRGACPGHYLHRLSREFPDQRRQWRADGARSAEAVGPAVTGPDGDVSAVGRENVGQQARAHRAAWSARCSGSCWRPRRRDDRLACGGKPRVSDRPGGQAMAAAVLPTAPAAAPPYRLSLVASPPPPAPPDTSVRYAARRGTPRIAAVVIDTRPGKVTLDVRLPATAPAPTPTHRPTSNTTAPPARCGGGTGGRWLSCRAAPASRRSNHPQPPYASPPGRTCQPVLRPGPDGRPGAQSGAARGRRGGGTRVRRPGGRHGRTGVRGGAGSGLAFRWRYLGGRRWVRFCHRSRAASSSARASFRRGLLWLRSIISARRCRAASS